MRRHQVGDYTQQRRRGFTRSLLRSCSPSFNHINMPARYLTSRFPSVLLATLLLGIFCSAASFAAQWTLASELKSTHRATAAEAKAVRRDFASAQILYNFEDDAFLIHDGDLVIDGNFDSNTRLVVRGNLKVKGFYTDYRDDIGVLIVTGTMSAENLYSWGALYVGKDLNVAGLALTVYNDFTFEVAGKVNARALVISDKSNDYKPGKLEIVLDESGDIRAAEMDIATRSFVPELFSRRDHFEPELDDDFYGLTFDDSYAKSLMSDEAPVFRKQIAAKGLYADVTRTMQSSLNDSEQIALLRQDLLLAQLIASRPDLSDSVAKALAAMKDPTVNTWLAASKPELVLAQSTGNLSPDLAQSLASNPETSLAALQDLSRHANPQVRRTVAKFEALPDSDAGRKMIDLLVVDPDADVRADVLLAFGYASAFGWNLSDAVIQARLADREQAVLNALAYAQLNAAQAKALIPKLDADGALQMALSLRQQAEQARPSRLSRAQITELAQLLVARKLAKEEYPRATTEAFLALPAAEQSAQLPTLIERKTLDLDKVMGECNSHAVLNQLAAISLTYSKLISDDLAENPFLPEALQVQIVQLAQKAPPKKDDDYSDHPIDALEELLGNDFIHPSAMNLAVDLALARGLQPADGSYQNALFHANTLTAEAISKLDAKLAGDEDWALTLMGQEAASVPQRVNSLRRWYDDDEDLIKSLKGAENLTLAQFYQRAAQSASINLQQYALGNPTLPLALVKALQASQHDDVAEAAKAHPQIPLAQLDAKLLADPEKVEYLTRLDPKDWLQLSQTATSVRTRAMAHGRYATMLRKAVLGRPRINSSGH
jgi:hypothetical protein